MLGFIYQYTVMWAVFALGLFVAFRNGELDASPRGRRQLVWLVGGMLGLMALQGALTPWGAP